MFLIFSLDVPDYHRGSLARYGYVTTLLSLPYRFVGQKIFPKTFLSKSSLKQRNLT